MHSVRSRFHATATIAELFFAFSEITGKTFLVEAGWPHGIARWTPARAAWDQLRCVLGQDTSGGKTVKDRYLPNQGE